MASAFHAREIYDLVTCCGISIPSSFRRLYFSVLLATSFGRLYFCNQLFIYFTVFTLLKSCQETYFSMEL